MILFQLKSVMFLLFFFFPFLSLGLVWLLGSELRHMNHHLFFILSLLSSTAAVPTKQMPIVWMRYSHLQNGNSHSSLFLPPWVESWNWNPTLNLMMHISIKKKQFWNPPLSLFLSLFPLLSNILLLFLPHILDHITFLCSSPHHHYTYQ